MSAVDPLTYFRKLLIEWLLYLLIDNECDWLIGDWSRLWRPEDDPGEGLVWVEGGQVLEPDCLLQYVSPTED